MLAEADNYQSEIKKEMESDDMAKSKKQSDKFGPSIRVPVVWILAAGRLDVSWERILLQIVAADLAGHFMTVSDIPGLFGEKRDWQGVHAILDDLLYHDYIEDPENTGILKPSRKALDIFGLVSV